MAQIDAVTFDLWDTLIQEVPGGAASVGRRRLEAISGLLESSGNPFGMVQLQDAYARTGDHLAAVWDRLEDVSVGEQVEFMLEALNQGLPGTIAPETVSEIERVYSESMLHHPPALLDGAMETLLGVRDTGVRLGLISNTGKTPGSTLRTMLERMGILSVFEVTVFSNEVRSRKPASEIFELTLETLETAPGRTVHVGDNPWADTDGAKAIGMMAIQVGTVKDRGSHEADAYVGDIGRVASALESLRRR